jgi:hypothetical protein
MAVPCGHTTLIPAAGRFHTGSSDRGDMEHTQNTRKTFTVLAVLAVAAGLASCATPQLAAGPGQSAITHRFLVRESADRYVDELVRRANATE